MWKTGNYRTYDQLQTNKNVCNNSFLLAKNVIECNQTKRLRHKEKEQSLIKLFFVQCA
jgi:hypothetical protein